MQLLSIIPMVSTETGTQPVPSVMIRLQFARIGLSYQVVRGHRLADDGTSRAQV